MRKNKPKEKSFTQGPIMLGITIGLGVFVITAAVMIGLSYLGLLSNDSEIPMSFTPEDKKYSPIKITIEDSVGINEDIP